MDPKKVLVVEDDLAIQPIVRTLLHSIDPNIKIDWATTADKVLDDLFENGKDFRQNYDLILADIFLPGTSSGFDLWELCKRRRSKALFLMTSGMSYAEFSEQHTLGNEDVFPFYLPKGIPLESRRKMLARLLGYREA